MADCEHLARTSAYYDGALAPADEPEALAHLAICDACQRVLGDAVGIDAALARDRGAANSAPVPRARRRAWPWGAAAVAVAAAAVVALWHAGPPARPAPEVALALPGERAVEARFTGAAFAKHRPLEVLRGTDRRREQIPLATLAALERRGDRADLVAALASSGDLARATEAAAALPAGASADSDRAAVALAAGDAEHALAEAYHALDRAPDLAAAEWNLALAARQLGVPRVARAAFARVEAAREPGWSEEAGAQRAALDRLLAADDGFAAFDRRGRAMVAGGPPITADDAARFPTTARIYLLDALRVAGSRAEVEALRPIARALDGATGTTTASAAVDRAAAADLAKRRPFIARYRALEARTASPAEIAALLMGLRAAGPAVANLYAGALILAGRERAHVAELAAITGPWHDPWFDLLVARARIHAELPDGDLRAASRYAAALEACTGDEAALRCGQLASELADLLAAAGNDAAALHRAEDALGFFRRAVFPALADREREFIAELHRRHGRLALARAGFEEVLLDAGGGTCAELRYARIGEASIAFAARDLAAARGALPPAAPAAGCAPDVDVIGLATAVDLARATGGAKDREVARGWLARARALGDADLAMVGEARLGLVPPAHLRTWLAAHASARDARTVAVREWAYATAISEAGERATWSDVLALARQEHLDAALPACVLVASADDDVVTIAARGPDGLTGDVRRVPAPELATAHVVSDAITRALHGCSEVAVIAPPPLHGRADLLPPEIAWWFVGDAPARTASKAPARSLLVGDARPPAALGLPALALPAARGFDVVLAGADATPARVLAALGEATYAELDVHGITSPERPEDAYLALTPDVSGAFALTIGAVRKAALRRAPVVVLGSCRAGEVTPLRREAQSLPDALIDAGARAVIAADVAIPDASARVVFDELHRRIAAGEPVAHALAAVRAAGPAWARHLVLFQ